MAFKLGSSNKKPIHLGGIKVVPTPLEKGTIAEARNDGTIAVDPKVKPGSKLMRRVIKHEMKHMKDMAEGRAAYGDNWLMWEDKIYIRKNGNIEGPNGKWPEGDAHHPWEAEAIAAEKQ